MDPGSTSRTGPSQSYHARYNESEENIFLQLQKRNLPERINCFSTSVIGLVNCNVFPIYHQLGIPDSDIAPYNEPRYVQYLLQEVPDTLGVGQLFPSAFQKIYAQSLEHEGLRYMMLAVACFLADNKNNQPPLYAFKYLQMGIPLIQQELTNETITDALIFGVFFTAYLHFLCGELASTKRHLQGLHLLLQRYQTSPTELHPVITPPAELMFIWRMAIRLDHTWAIGDQDLIFPLVSKQDELHREWVSKLVDREKPETTEWILAQFALDDLLTRGIALNKKVIRLRSAVGYDKEIVEAAIEQETIKLLEEHGTWNQRSCVKAALTAQAHKVQANEDCIDNHPPVNTLSSSFLRYPPFKFTDQFYGANLIQYYWVLLYITFIAHPKPGPLPYKRFEIAIKFCRSYAAVRRTKTVGICRMVLGLYLAGLTLSEPVYPTGPSNAIGKKLIIEFAWIAEQFEGIDKECGSRIGATILNILRTTWRSEGSHYGHYITGINR